MAVFQVQWSQLATRGQAASPLVVRTSTLWPSVMFLERTQEVIMFPAYLEEKQQWPDVRWLENKRWLRGILSGELAIDPADIRQRRELQEYT